MAKLICTVCARGGSKGVPSKNKRLLQGLPLIAHTVLQAKSTGLFDAIVVSTDDPEIGQIAQDHGASFFFLRPAELATDTAAKLPVIRHALVATETHLNMGFDEVVDLDPTSPLRLASDIVEAVEVFRNGGYDNLFSVTEARKSPYFNMVEKLADGGIGLSKTLTVPVLRRQDAPVVYEMNASIYVWKRAVLMSDVGIFGPKSGIYEMAQERSIDIDSPVDFKMVEVLMAERNTHAG